MDTVMIEVMMPWNGQSHPTKDMRFSRVPFVGEHLELNDGFAAWRVETVIHMQVNDPSRQICAQVRVK